MPFQYSNLFSFLPTLSAKLGYSRSNQQVCPFFMALDWYSKLSYIGNSQLSDKVYKLRLKLKNWFM